MRSVVSRSAKVFVLPAPPEGVSESGLAAELKFVSPFLHCRDIPRTLPHFLRELPSVQKAFLHVSIEVCCSSITKLEGEEESGDEAPPAVSDSVPAPTDEAPMTSTNALQRCSAVA